MFVYLVIGMGVMLVARARIRPGNAQVDTLPPPLPMTEAPPLSEKGCNSSMFSFKTEDETIPFQAAGLTAAAAEHYAHNWDDEEKGAIDNPTANDLYGPMSGMGEMIGPPVVAMPTVGESTTDGPIYYHSPPPAYSDGPRSGPTTPSSSSNARPTSRTSSGRPASGSRHGKSTVHPETNAHPSSGSSGAKPTSKSSGTKTASVSSGTKPTSGAKPASRSSSDSGTTRRRSTTISNSNPPPQPGKIFIKIIKI